VPSGGPVPKLVRLVQLDGKLPNLALMKLAHWHRQQGWDVQFTRHVDRGILDREPDAVYGSCIFKYSRQHLTRFVKEWPQAVVGGTGSDSLLNVEHLIGQACEVAWNFHNGHECASLDEALVSAKLRGLEYNERMSELERVNQARAERAREHELRQAEHEQRQTDAEARDEQKRETEAVRQLREEQLLLDMLKDDPVAVTLLKLFVDVQAEREHWLARIDGLEEASAWAESCHGEHLARVHEEAKTSERLAREADERARDLDSELDETKRKARKAGVKV